MRRYILALFMFLAATLACMSTAPKTSAPKLPTAIVVTEGLAAPPMSTPVAMQPAPSQSPAAPVESAAKTEFPLRLEISTSSDWTNLEIRNSGIVRDARIVATEGVFTNHTAAPDLIAMNQDLANAQAGKTIKLTVDLWIEPSATAEKVDMILGKGDIGLVTLKFYKQSGGADVLIREIAHEFPEGGPTGLNELAFSIPLK